MQDNNFMNMCRDGAIDLVVLSRHHYTVPFKLTNSSEHIFTIVRNKICAKGLMTWIVVVILNTRYAVCPSSNDLPRSTQVMSSQDYLHRYSTLLRHHCTLHQDIYFSNYHIPRSKVVYILHHQCFPHALQFPRNPTRYKTYAVSRDVRKTEPKCS